MKRRSSGGRFLALPSSMIESDEFATLSPRAVKLLIDIAAQYRGTNNGDLDATWSRMRKRGWTSKGLLTKARDELVKSGFIVMTCPPRWRGTRMPTCFAITWRAVDQTKNTLDIAPSRTALNYWKSANLAVRPAGRTDPPVGSMQSKFERHRPASRVDTAPFPNPIDPPGGHLSTFLPEASTSNGNGVHDDEL